jgi:hypothetical protein
MTANKRFERALHQQAELAVSAALKLNVVAY